MTSQSAVSFTSPLNTAKEHSAKEDRLSSAYAVSGRSRLGSLGGFAIAATGSYLPSHVVTNDDLAELGYDGDWIVKRTGIRERHKAGDHESASDMGRLAAFDCLKNAGVAPQEVDLIVVATMTPDHLTPSTACLLQRQLGCIAPAFDVNSACSGFMYAMVTAGHFVQSGMARRALVIGSEVMSRCVNPSDPKTYPLFGDGAGAALLVPTDRSEPALTMADGLLAYTLGAEGCGGETLCVPAGGSRLPLTADLIDRGAQYLRMEGRTVFKWAIGTVEDATRDVLHAAHLSLTDISQFIFHQANTRILDAVAENLGIERDRVCIQVDRVGNTSAASIPLALHEVVQQGKLTRGDLLLLCGFGAGLTWGAGILRW